MAKKRDPGKNRRERTRANTRWTKSEEAELTRRFHQGQTVEQMAKAHGRTLGGIESRLTKLNLSGAIRRADQPAIEKPRRTFVSRLLRRP